MTLHHITIHDVTLRNITRHYITLFTLHHITLCYATLPKIALRSLHSMTLHWFTLHHTAFHYATAHYHTTHSLHYHALKCLRYIASDYTTLNRIKLPCTTFVTLPLIKLFPRTSKYPGQDAGVLSSRTLQTVLEPKLVGQAKMMSVLNWQDAGNKRMRVYIHPWFV